LAFRSPTPSCWRTAARCRCTTGSRMDWWFGCDCRFASQANGSA
jgi:hypothetical protein